MKVLSIFFISLLSVYSCALFAPEREPTPIRITEPTKHFVYICASGRAIMVSYPSDETAIVVYEDQSLNLATTVAASGVRYVGDGMVWWTKGVGVGAEGMLLRQEEGGGETLVERCKARTARWR